MSDVHPSEAEGRTPRHDGCTCMAWKDQIPKINGPIGLQQIRSGQRLPDEYFIPWNVCPWCGSAISRIGLAARSPAPSDEPRRCTCPGPWRADPRIHEHDCYLRPAAPSVEARETLLGYPLRVDSSIPADEIRFVQNGQIVGVIRLAPASLLPPEKT